jgi:N-methylhydantoinase A
LLAFGGAGPLMATELARELDIAHIVVPPHAGNFSAWGLLGADLVQSRARTRITRLSLSAIAETNALLEELFASLIGRDAQTADSVILEVGLDMRFAGQEHTLTVSPASTGGRLTCTIDELRSTFIREYTNAFETTLNGDIEIVSTRASVRRPLPRRDEAPPAAAIGTQPERRLSAFSFAAGRQVEFTIADRFSMPANTKRAGPLVIVEPTTTTYVDIDFETEIDSSGCLHLRHRRSRI